MLLVVDDQLNPQLPAVTGVPGSLVRKPGAGVSLGTRNQLRSASDSAMLMSVDSRLKVWREFCSMRGDSREVNR